VGLLNIGEEASKGNDLAVRTHQMLQNILVAFIGNAEGRDVLPVASMSSFVMALSATSC